MPTETKTYHRNGQKITEEITPIAEVPPVQAQAASSVVSQPLAEVSAISPSQGATKLTPTEEEKPIAAFMPQTREERIKAMMEEINRLKREQEELKKERNLKLERLRQKWHSITERIKAKHPYITAIIEKGLKAAGPAARAALGAGKNLAKGLGSLALKIAQPETRQGIVNSLDYYTRDFTPERQTQNPIDRIAGIRYTPPPTPPPQQATPQRPTIPTNQELEREAERLRLQRSIINQRTQLANQKAILEGKPAPYPSVQAYAPHERRPRHKSLGEIVRQIEKEKLQAELDRGKRLATA